ncbi:MAG: hypothetical protein R2788_16335 [Saprospiraceae bacterium]
MSVLAMLFGTATIGRRRIMPMQKLFYWYRPTKVAIISTHMRSVYHGG